MGRPYQTGDVRHSIIDLSQLNHEQKIAEKSVLSDNFAEKVRTYGGKNIK